MGTPVEAKWQPISRFPGTAAFFDLDKTIISKSSTLAFGPSFYRHGLLSRSDVIRSGLAQLRFRATGASHRRMEKVREQVSQACRGWPADRVIDIVNRNLESLILPYVYAEARALLSEHRGAGQDVIIVSTSGQEVVAPIGALLGAQTVIATRMRITDGCYTGEMDFYAYGEAKARWQPPPGRPGSGRRPGRRHPPSSPVHAPRQCQQECNGRDQSRSPILACTGLCSPADPS